MVQEFEDLFVGAVFGLPGACFGGGGLDAAVLADERHLADLGLSNYWGYNPAALFVPDPRLAPGGIDEDFVHVTEAVRQLRSLQATGTPAKRRAVLRRVVSEFNRLDRRASFIDTSEAEQIVAWVEALAAAVGLDNDEERLTGHRDW